MNKLLTELMAMLEGLRLLHHACHLSACGRNSYATHLLFERLYGAIVDEFDAIGEHAVRRGAKIDACQIGKQAYEWQEKWDKSADCIERALGAEKALQTALAALVKKMDNDLGLDNTLRSMAEKHGTHIYLLQQNREEKDRG